ncbi:uncharacterized protein LOC132295902 [Cornus florida]|uniref:uncharacterized protein LOC132295902 n=1 Tax=Cornus florida TaxID=4283 RepID=UPI00289DA947|nr:uncharacterized protein LOC132295902 [Cornus florida]
MANEASQSISLKVLVEKKRNLFVFAESSNDFVDVLFSFMTMPIGSIITLAHEHSIEVDLGCLNDLYESVEDLDEARHVWCKDLLLRPRNAAKLYCRYLKLNFVDGDIEYHTCSDRHHFSPYSDALYHCGGFMSRSWIMNKSMSAQQDGGVFVKPAARFLITDDFHVKPISTVTGLSLLSKFGAMDKSIREESSISMGRDKILKLLICSLTSRTPFSKTILELAIDKSNVDICPENYEAKEDFVDLIGSFLTFPLGCVFKEFPCLSLRGCLGNLYKSIQDSDVGEFLESEEMKAILVNPKLARGFALNKQLIPIEQVPWSSYSFINSLPGFVPKVNERIIGKGFFRGPSMFLVTDDLRITLLSLFSDMSLLDRLNIPHSDMLEQEVTMGEEEALRMLEAALVSKTALTDAFILKKRIKAETQ